MRRALIVGAGASGLLHALALRSAGIAIGMVFDPDRERAALLTSIAGGIATDAFADAVTFDGEVAAICSPPPFHVAQAEALGRRDRLLFVEKPIATSPAELARLRRVPDVVPMLQWRAGRAARQLRRAFEAGAFGRAPEIAFDLETWRDDDYFARRGRELWGCGAMLSIGIHAVDLVTWIVGRNVVFARARETYGRRDVDVPTRGELAISFEGGARAIVRLTLDAARSNEARLVVRGPLGSAELVAGEADPTGAPLVLHGIDPAVVKGAGGAEGSPLVVPFVHDAIAAFDAGKRTLVAVDDVARAHTLAFSSRSAEVVYER